MVRSVTVAAAALLVGGSALPARAQERGGSPAAVSALAGVYSDAQARRGANAYDKNCTQCHLPAAHVGPAFWSTWVGRTAFDLFEYLRTTMPNERPGRLSRGQYVDIVAYLFQLNGLPAGEKSQLPTDDQRLKQISIAAPPEQHR